MKFNLFFFFFYSVILPLCVCSQNTQSGNSIKPKSGELPVCIKQLIRHVSNGRNSATQFTYQKAVILANGKKIYCLHNLAVIGCASRTPAATSYYDDSCRLIARFPDNFFIKQLRRPFLAVGYNPNDFPESLSGDYPAYFANLPDSFTNSANGVQASGSSENQFRKKRVFTIGQIYDSTIIFQNGDVIIISTQEGLSHYRNKKLLHTYKIIPGLRTQLYQLQNRVAASSKIEKRKIIYYMGGIKKYIDISAGQLLVSVADYEDPLRSSDNKVVLMEVVCEVSPKS